MGNLYHYCMRYPEVFKLYALEEESELNCYDDSVRYNDSNIANLIKIFNESNVEGTFTYLSDHGEDVIGGNAHKAAKFNQAMIKIPLLVYLSANWKEKYPDTQDKGVKNINKVFTNDLLFDLMLDLWRIKTTGVERNSRYSLFNSNYKLTNPLTLHGKRKIKLSNE